MDLITIGRLLRRHRVVSLTIVSVTVLVALAVLFLFPRTYQSTASFVLAMPPAGPTDAQIAANPQLGKVNRNNPYLRFQDASTAGQVLSNRLSGDDEKHALAAQGADTSYTIGPSPELGASGQLLNLVAAGSSSAEATKTMNLLVDRMKQDLYSMQKVYGADDSALITALPVQQPTPPNQVLSGTIRTLIGVFAAGLIVLFGALSVAEYREGNDAPGGPAHAKVNRAPGRGRPKVVGEQSSDVEQLGQHAAPAADLEQTAKSNPASGSLAEEGAGVVAGVGDFQAQAPPASSEHGSEDASDRSRTPTG